MHVCVWRFSKAYYSMTIKRNVDLSAVSFCKLAFGGFPWITSSLCRVWVETAWFSATSVNKAWNCINYQGKNILKEMVVGGRGGDVSIALVRIKFTTTGLPFCRIYSMTSLPWAGKLHHEMCRFNVNFCTKQFCFLITPNTKANLWTRRNVIYALYYGGAWVCASLIIYQNTF